MNDYQARDKKYIWHPFTQMKEWIAQEQIVIESGEGDFLIDTKGRRYIDGVSSLWCNVHGHRRAEIDSAIRAQLDKIAHSTMLGLTHTAAVDLSEKLLAIVPPSLKRVFYSDSGSEAAEIALKMAFQYWQHQGHADRTHFVALRESYHGDTIGSVSVGGIETFHSLFRPLLFHTYFAPVPARRWNEEGVSAEEKMRASLAEIERIFTSEKNKIAAIIVEPLVQGAGGIIVHPPGFLRGVRELCNTHDVLMICDEVAVGFGRTGRMFACEHEGVSPDIMTVAKGITAGYLPLAATLVAEKIFAQYLGEHSECKTFFHGHTYTANPLACAAAIANLEIFEKEKVLENLQIKIATMSELLEPLKNHPYVAEVRQCGFIGAIEIAEDLAAGQPYPAGERMGARVCAEARKHGLIVRPLGDAIVLMPPLGIADENLRRMLAIVAESIDTVCGGRK